MSDKIRKYVLPNLPYLFVFWFFSKIGTAYRIAVSYTHLDVYKRQRIYRLIFSDSVELEAIGPYGWT